MSNKVLNNSFYNNSLAIRSEIQRFESVHPSIYAIYDLLELIPDPLLSQQIRDHVVCIEDSFVNSQEWTLSRTVPDIRLGLVGHLSSGKSALVHRYLTGSYMQDESPEGGRFKKEVVVDGNSYLLLIRDEGGFPEQQFSSWVDGVIFVFSLDSEDSFKSIGSFYTRMGSFRNLSQVPLLLVGTQDAICETRPRVIDEGRARKLALDLHRCPYYETCATYGLNVERVFQDACQKIAQSKLSTVAANNGHKETEVPLPALVEFLAPSTPTSTPNTARKNRRRSNLFQPLKKCTEDDRKLKNGEVGSGRIIPLRQGYLYKKSSKPLNKEWKKKYVALTNAGTLTYHPNLHDYMAEAHGKEIPLVHTTVKVPGQLRKPRSSILQDSDGSTPGEMHLLPVTNPTLAPPSLVKKRHHRRLKNASLRSSDLAEDAEGFEFTIVSLDNKQWQFEASTMEDRDAWVAAIEQQILCCLQSNESNKQTLPGSSIVEVQALRSPAGNQHCLDCDAPNPSWASLNLGGLMCIECSGIHRNLGTHISRVRSLDLDVWLPEHLSVMTAVGNAAANSVWEACVPPQRAKPTPHSSREERERWIKAKYEQKEFLRPLKSQPPPQQQLSEAVGDGDVLAVYHLLVHGTTGAPGSRLLHVAAESGNLAISQLLLWARVADPRATDPEGRTPLVLARMGGFRDLARLLLLHSSAEPL